MGDDDGYYYDDVDWRQSAYIISTATTQCVKRGQLKWLGVGVLGSETGKRVAGADVRAYGVV